MCEYVKEGDILKVVSKVNINIFGDLTDRTFTLEEGDRLLVVDQDGYEYVLSPYGEEICERLPKDEEVKFVCTDEDICEDDNFERWFDEVKDRELIKKLMDHYAEAQVATTKDDLYHNDERAKFEKEIKKVHVLTEEALCRLSKYEPRIAVFYNWLDYISNGYVTGNEYPFIDLDWDKIFTASPWLNNVKTVWEDRNYDIQSMSLIEHLSNSDFANQFGLTTWTRLVSETDKFDSDCDWRKFSKKDWETILQRRPSAVKHLIMDFRAMGISEEDLVPLLPENVPLEMNSDEWVCILRCAEKTMSCLRVSSLKPQQWMRILYEIPEAAAVSPYDAWNCQEIVEAVKDSMGSEFSSPELLDAIFSSPVIVEHISNWDVLDYKDWGILMEANAEVWNNVVSNVLKRVPFLIDEEGEHPATGAKDLPVVAFYSGDKGMPRTCDWMSIGDPCLCTFKTTQECGDFAAEFCSSRYYYVGHYDEGAQCYVSETHDGIFVVHDANGKPVEFFVVLKK